MDPLSQSPNNDSLPLIPSLDDYKLFDEMPTPDLPLIISSPSPKAKRFSVNRKKLLVTISDLETLDLNSDILRDTFHCFGKSIVLNPDFCKIIAAKETHLSGKYHLHLFICLKKPFHIRRSDFFNSILKKQANICKVDSLSGAVKYVTKDLDFITHGYSAEEIRLICDGKLNRMQMALSKLADFDDWRQFAKTYPDLFIKYHRGIVILHNIFVEDKLGLKTPKKVCYNFSLTGFHEYTKRLKQEQENLHTQSRNSKVERTTRKPLSSTRSPWKSTSVSLPVQRSSTGSDLPVAHGSASSDPQRSRGKLHESFIRSLANTSGERKIIQWIMRRLSIDNVLKAGCLPDQIFKDKSLYIYGKTNLGKTSLYLTLNKIFNVWVPPTLEKFFDTYSDTVDLILFDEFYPNHKISFYNKLLEGATMNLGS